LAALLHAGKLKIKNKRQKSQSPLFFKTWDFDSDARNIWKNSELSAKLSFSLQSCVPETAWHETPSRQLYAKYYALQVIIT